MWSLNEERSYLDCRITTEREGEPSPQVSAIISTLESPEWVLNVWYLQKVKKSETQFVCDDIF